MKVREIMTADVITVTPDTPVQRIASLLLDHGISAVPVCEKDIPVGMISESDLVARIDSAARRSRLSWVLRMLSATQSGAPSSRQSHAPRSAVDVMSSPVITTGPEAEAVDVASLMIGHAIKRVPVVEAGKIVGIVSRADLLRAYANGLSGSTDFEPPSALAALFGSIDRTFHNRAKPADVTPATLVRTETVLSAADLRERATHSRASEAEARAEARRRIAERHQHEVDEALSRHLNADTWRRILAAARVAAEHGESEYVAMQFPREVCSDGGRAINIGSPEWPQTLRGEAAELWLRCQQELEPKGFRVHARILDYEDGVPGHVGLILVWGE